MIEKIFVENFRSILKLETKLTQLTVLIGANGTGKSNLVKLLEFIGDIPESGVNMAINKRGGSEWMLPKSIPTSKLRSVVTSVGYTTTFSPPKDTSSKLKRVNVDHFIKLKFKAEGLPYVKSEELTFHNVLSVSRLLNNKDSLIDLPDDHFASPSIDSTFSLKQKEIGGLEIECLPSVNEENMNDYLEWLGLSESLKIKPRYFTSNLKRLWSSREIRIRGSKLQKRKRSYSFLDENITTVLDFCSHYHRFRSEVASIARYDLLLNELRKEQNLSDEDEFMTDGTNMPSIVKKIKNKDKTESWDRLRETFFAIAPHITQLGTSSLRTNKEFIRFAESEIGRPVESWEASDGSLRALAVLLAIETATSGTTVIIEEPEQNLHPWAIRILMNYIVDMIKKKSLQVIITTHSQQVLESAKPEEILVANRTIQEGTTFKRLSDLHPDLCSEEIGKLWVKGLLGGVPNYD